jgi:hypothetical protein
MINIPQKLLQMLIILFTLKSEEFLKKKIFLQKLKKFNVSAADFVFCFENIKLL